MEKVFFTSDLHFGHKNILKYEDRPFSSIEEMDQKMIENWNKKVGSNDEIYILGDLAFGNKKYVKNLLEKLNGKKYMIRGNHDRYIDKEEISNEFQWVKDYYLLNHSSGIKLVLFHYPICSCAFMQYGSIHLFGHIHKDNIVMNKNAYNVGADVNNYEPIELKDILEKLK